MLKFFRETEKSPVFLAGLNCFKDTISREVIGISYRGTLNAPLEDADHAATELYGYLAAQPAKKDGITEWLKATDQMEWIERMDNIRNQAHEIVQMELICI